MSDYSTVQFRNKRGLWLHGAIHGEPSDVMAISCHGMLSTKDGAKHAYLAACLKAYDIPTLRFDFSGCGESEGELFDLSYSSEMDDLHAAVDHLVSLGAVTLGVFGSSMGGSIALLTAARNARIKAVATLAAVGHPEEIEQRFPQACSQWQQRGYVDIEGEGRIGKGFLDDALKHDVISAVGVLAAPLLVIHGSEDKVVPPVDAHDIASAARHVSLEMVEGADHRFSSPLYMRPAMQRVAEFLALKLRAPS
jgi:uncharacterized protein